jgi:putative DNA primase/helicase
VDAPAAQIGRVLITDGSHGDEGDCGFVAKPPASEPSKRIKLIMGSEVKAEAIAWLWPGWLAHGKLHIIAGRPGTLKTTTALSLAAAVTIGGKWPDGSPATSGKVIIWSGEDAIEDTLLPRFIAAGGDPARVAFISGVEEDGKKRSFDPAADMGALVDLCDRVGSISLVNIDPIVAVAKSDSQCGDTARPPAARRSGRAHQGRSPESII